MSKILVTGASGFIGGNFVNYLSNDKSKYVVATGRKQNKFTKIYSAEWMEKDLLFFDNCLDLTKGMEQVYHFAADMGGIGYIKSDQAQIMRRNVVIDMNMLEASRINGVKRFFFSSSSCAYPRGITEDYIVPPMTEEKCYPADPDNSYGWAKIMTEQACYHYRKNYGMETRVARFFSVYGPELEYEGDVAKSLISICRKVALAKDGTYIELWGNGKEYRSFCYITDMLEGIYKLMNSDYPYPMNLGSDQPEPINILAQRIINISGKKLEIVHQPAKEIGVKGRRCDITKARDILRWEPKISLTEGLTKTYNWVLEDLRKNGKIL